MNCKKILALLLTLVMLVTVLPMGALTVSAESTTEFLGGDGTEESPYLISNKTHLNNVRNHPGSHFKMVADIVFTEADFAKKGDYYNNGQGWQPIGTDDGTTFIGVFDGNGHTIKGLYVNIQKTNTYIYAGLFGYNEGTIKNLGMLDGSVSATSTSTSSYSSSHAGGIAGVNIGTISDCYNAGSVSSSSSYSKVGGIAGWNDGTISDCYNTGSVSATSDSFSRAGGIAGGNGGTISNCYNTGSASSSVSASSSDSYAGGIAGQNYGTISNCYNAGSASASVSHSSSYSSYSGGIAGRNHGTIGNCYNTGSVSASSDSSSSAGGIAGWNYGTISNCYNTGSASSSVSASSTASYSYAGGIAGQNWNDGTISNCYNTGSVSASSDSSSSAGGIAGWNYGTISNCYNTGSASSSVSASSTASYSYAGGIAGENYGTISNCYNMGNVSASSDSSSYAGGIAGYNREGGTISNCYYLNIIAKGVGGGTDNTVSCTLKQMTQQDTFVGFDFDTVWTMEGNEDYLYPELQNVPMQFEKELASISVTPPTKTEYLEGKETLDITGGKLTLTYNNGTSEVIDLTTDMVNGFDNTKIGKQTLTVTYQEKTTTFEVEIIAKSLDGIAVTAPPTKTKYLEGKEQLDVTGGKLTLTYNNETTEVIDLTADMVSGFDNTKVGKQTLTVTYQGKTTTLEVEIIAKSLDSIKVTTLPSKRNYLEGKDKLDVTGGKLTLTYNNGTTEVIDLAADMVSGFDNTKVGKQTLTVTYQGKTTTFEVEIIAVTVPFRDVDKDAYYAAAVEWAVSNEITNGTSDTTFSPDEGCTRAQVVTFLWRAAGKPDPASSESPFSDVKPDAYYYNAVLWAVEKGITNGTSDKTFSPDETCTRAQIVTFLWRYEEQQSSR